MNYAEQNKRRKKATDKVSVVFLLVAVLFVAVLFMNCSVVKASEEVTGGLFVTISETPLYSEQQEEDNKIVEHLDGNISVYVTGKEKEWYTVFYQGKNVYVKESMLIPAETAAPEVWEAEWKQQFTEEEYEEEIKEYVKKEKRKNNKGVAIASAVVITATVAAAGQIVGKRKRNRK